MLKAWVTDTIRSPAHDPAGSDVLDGMKGEAGIVVHQVIEAAFEPIAQLVVTGPVMTPAATRSTIGSVMIARVDSQVAPVGQVGQHLVRHAAEPHLQRGAIVDQAGDVAGDLLGHIAGGFVEIFHDGGFDRDEALA